MATESLKTLGERLRELREEHDLSLRELAKKLKVSAAFLSDVELGRRHPSDDLFQRLADTLEAKLEELREYDTRAPVQELKRLTAANPAYGIALRSMVENRVRPDEIMEFLKRRNERTRKQ
ncbi:MAG: helix-turn-helix transcriptional regulator [Candidatus Binataceae bacterium]|nr:helix-turn-helix transcriptional regulator [Candidatus Binataceae bacterium]